MSRYRIPHIRYDIAVGWDPPLNTCCGIIIDTRAVDEERALLWLGDDWNQYPDVEEFCLQLALAIEQLGLTGIRFPAGLPAQLAWDQQWEGMGKVRPAHLLQVA
jgi:hypothetical protein